ncbi:MAG: AAA domain-containing protein [Candidatus Peribacteraceae bacterium]|jgi:hypothetical protein
METDLTLLPQLRIEYNLPRPLTSQEIEGIRNNVEGEVARLLPEYQFARRFPHDDAGAEPPFGEEVITQKEETEGRYEAMLVQMALSLRYLDETIALDTELSGGQTREGLTALGVRLTVQEAKQRGHHATIVARNTWGSNDYHDPSLRKELHRTVVDYFGETEEKYESILTGFLKDDVQTGYDIPVLREDDRVEIYNSKDQFVGTATVKEARGDVVELYVRSPKRVKRGFYLRKKSNRRTLERYKNSLHEYCERLGMQRKIRDRHGEPYLWEGETVLNEFGVTYSQHSLPEQVFFGIDQDTERLTRKQIMRRTDEFQPIPRALLGDTEQSVAFELGTEGYPCFLVQGPPGTGKTMVASYLVQGFQQQGLRTLVLSHSNRGLDVLLNAVKKKKCVVHRGGTEIGVCDKALREDFIRKDLHPPKQEEYLVEQTDEAAYAEALKRHTEGEPLPQRGQFQTVAVDAVRYEKAWKEFSQKRAQLIQQLWEEQGLVAGVTLNSLISDEILQELSYDVVMVDEASRGYFYELLPALAKAGQQIIFIGDHKQLGNIALPQHLRSFMQDRQDAVEGGIGEQDVQDFEAGPFAFMAERTSIPQVMLRTNRRSLPGIVELVSLARYDGKLKAGKIDHHNPSNPGEMMWVDTKERADRGETSFGLSKVNYTEAHIVARRLVNDFYAGRLTDDNFGVISMYSAQRNLIIRLLQRMEFRNPSDRDALLNFLQGNNGTVDSFQGSERARIILSTTRSNLEQRIGHLDSTERTNVAFSRAQESLVVTGDSRTLIEGNPDGASQTYFRIARECIERHGKIVDVFPHISTRTLPGPKGGESHNARRNRFRKQRKKAARSDEAEANRTEA